MATLCGVRVEMPSEFRRSGNDLYVSKEIDYVEAAPKLLLEISLPEGERRYPNPGGTNPNTVFRMKNLGVPSVSGGRRGDLLVTVRVNISKPSSKEKRTIQQLQK